MCLTSKISHISILYFSQLNQEQTNKQRAHIHKYHEILNCNINLTKLFTVTVAFTHSLLAIVKRTTTRLRQNPTARIYFYRFSVNAHLLLFLFFFING